MKFRECRYLILSDLYRITGKTTSISLLRELLIGSCFKYNFWMRSCRYARTSSILLKWIIYPIARLMLRHYNYRLGISIPCPTEIGSGFLIGHYGGIVVNRFSRIGKNCNILQGVTVGETFRGKSKGYPTIGDNVYLGPGAKIIGAVKVGNDVAIGANCVVTHDIPDHAVVVGVPGRIISFQGSEGYIMRTDYEDKLGHLLEMRVHTFAA